MLTHFWDNVENDSVRYFDTTTLEAFIYLGSYCKSESFKKSLFDLLKDSYKNIDFYSNLIYIIDKLIGYPDSIYRNDKLEEDILTNILSSNLPKEYKLWPKYKLTKLRKNRVGNYFSDIPINVYNVGLKNLSDYIGSNLVVIFANSTCSSCQSFFEKLSSPIINQALTRKEYKIIIILIDNPSKNPLSDKWIVAGDLNYSVLNEEIYTAFILPAIYIIDSAGYIISREMTTSQFINYLIQD